MSDNKQIQIDAENAQNEISGNGNKSLSPISMPLNTAEQKKLEDGTPVQPEQNGTTELEKVNTVSATATLEEEVEVGFSAVATLEEEREEENTAVATLEEEREEENTAAATLEEEREEENTAATTHEEENFAALMLEEVVEEEVTSAVTLEEDVEVEFSAVATLEEDVEVEFSAVATLEEILKEEIDEDAAANTRLFDDGYNDETTLSEEELDLLTEELDLRAGVSEDRDEFGREILQRNFVNLLTMSKNMIKRLYSRAKNAILSYKEVKTEYLGEYEYFRRGKEYLFRIGVQEVGLEIALALPQESLDKAVYPHKKIERNEIKKGLEIVVLATGKPTMERATELIRLVADLKGLERNEAGTMVAYAERYPVNCNGVLCGAEGLPPVIGQYDQDEYEDVTEGVIGEIIEQRKSATAKKAKVGKTENGETQGAEVDAEQKEDDGNGTDVLKKQSGEEQLEERRQTAKNIKAAIALQEPIVYYYDVAVDKEDKPAYINVKQVLNDKFLGKLLPPQYFAVAEGSERIEDLNLLQVQQAAEECNRYPDKWFAVPVSCRMLLKEKTLQKLIKVIKTDADNMLLALDCSLLETLGTIGIRAVAELRQNGAKIMLDNSENAGMRALTDYEYEMIRFDHRYYSANDKRQTAHLQMITGYAKALGIRTAATNVPSIKDAVFLITKGVDVIESFVISEPKRAVHTALKERKKLPPVR